MGQLRLYLTVSSAIALGTIFYAYNEYEQFYPTTVHLTTNKICIVIIGNFGFAIALAIAHVIQITLFGGIDPDESRDILERAKYSVLEICIALTMFRQDLTTYIFCLFIGELFMKGFHQLAQMRVDRLAREAPTRGRFLRVLGALIVLWMIDALIVAVLFGILYHTRKFNVLAQFLFDFSILLISMSKEICKFFVLSIDQYYDSRWEYKAVAMFTIEFPADLLRLIMYIAYFVFVTLNISLPIHSVRGLLYSCNNLLQRCVSFYRYRQLVGVLDSAYPSLTKAEIEASGRDAICIICMCDIELGKQLPCSHAFHLSCLKRWIEQKQECPMCKHKITPNNLSIRRWHRHRRRNNPVAAQAPREAQQAQPAQPQQPQPIQGNDTNEPVETPQQTSNSDGVARVLSGMPVRLIPPRENFEAKTNTSETMNGNEVVVGNMSYEDLARQTLDSQQMMQFHQMCARHYERMFRDSVLLQRKFFDQQQALQEQARK